VPAACTHTALLTRTSTCTHAPSGAAAAHALHHMTSGAFNPELFGDLEHFLLYVDNRLLYGSNYLGIGVVLDEFLFQRGLLVDKLYL
jgi:hypothetical protein